MNNLLSNKKIVIVGLGLIGGSYAKGLMEKGYNVGAINNEIDSINYGIENGFIVDGRDFVDEEYLKSADIIVFALYPKVLLEWIKNYQHLLKPETIITDVTGIKVGIIYKIEEILRKDLHFVGAHPMAGREVYGIKNANPEIFKNANYIVTPTNNTKKEAMDVAIQIGKELGFKNISILTPEEHDEMIAFLSQLTHCIAVALMCSKNSEHLVEYTGDSFRDLTRIAKINENMWTELFLMNREELLSQMELFSQKFTELKEAIALSDSKKIKEMMITSTIRRSYFDK